MISKQLFTSVILSGLLLSQATWAMTPVQNLADAKALMLSVGEELGSGNDANAVFIVEDAKAKSLLIEILRGQKKTQDIAVVKSADYLGVVVQNNDEEVLYYYAIHKGQTQAVEVGNRIEVVDLDYYVCPTGSKPAPFPKKFTLLKNLLLGADTKASLIGTVWFEDVECVN